MTPAVPPATRCDIDLDAIAANCRAIAERATVPLIAVVKADGYGHGAEAVAATAVTEGAAMVAVATIAEALALRGSGVTAPILMLLGVADRAEADAAVAAGLTVAVWDRSGALRVSEAASAARTTIAVQIKVDTGLTRLGAAVADAPTFIGAVAALRGVRIDGVYTHLATADEPDLGTARAQVALFGEFLDALSDRPRWVHVTASAGLAALGPVAGCTAVRVGLALYGVAAAPHLARSLALTPAMSWHTTVLRVAGAPRGTGVAYGHEFRFAQDGRVATIAVGYGDGLPRGAWPRGRVLVGGGLAPVIGRVSMDLTVVDVSDLPDVSTGDEVVLIGSLGGIRQTATDLASTCGTISHQLFAGIGARVPRRYLRAARVVATKTLVAGYRLCR